MRVQPYSFIFWTSRAFGPSLQSCLRLHASCRDTTAADALVQAYNNRITLPACWVPPLRHTALTDFGKRLHEIIPSHPCCVLNSKQTLNLFPTSSRLRIAPQPVRDPSQALQGCDCARCVVPTGCPNWQGAHLCHQTLIRRFLVSVHLRRLQHWKLRLRLEVARPAAKSRFIQQVGGPKTFSVNTANFSGLSDSVQRHVVLVWNTRAWTPEPYRCKVLAILSPALEKSPP